MISDLRPRVANDENSANENNYSPVRVSWESEPRKKEDKIEVTAIIVELSFFEEEEDEDEDEKEELRDDCDCGLEVLLLVSCRRRGARWRKQALSSQEASCWMLSSVVCCAELGCV